MARKSSDVLHGCLMCLMCPVLFYRCCHFIWHSEGSPEKVSLSSSMEPAHFDRCLHIRPQQLFALHPPMLPLSLLLYRCFSNRASLFSLSGVFSGKLCSDSLGNAEMLRPLVVARNRQSPGQISTSG